MEITRREENGVPVLTLHGRLDQKSADALEAAAMEIGQAGDGRGLVIEMTGVDFIASVGIRALIRPAQALSRRGGRLAISNLQPQMGDFFKLTGLDQMFLIHRTTEEAVAGLSA